MFLRTVKCLKKYLVQPGTFGKAENFIKRKKKKSPLKRKNSNKRAFFEYNKLLEIFYCLLLRKTSSVGQMCVGLVHILLFLNITLKKCSMYGQGRKKCFSFPTQ